MSRTNELSYFRSAVEWPEMLPEFEEATGELKPLSVFVIEAIDTLSIACTIAPDCESPIEIDLGARLTKVFRVVDDPNLLLVPQYILGPFRYDFAITRKGRAKPIALVECDGKDFHQSEDQLANDRAKDSLAAKEGIFLFRFSGSEIFRDLNGCVAQILKMMRYRGHFTQQQCDVLDLAPNGCVYRKPHPY
jgi:very-short-patch-repair endonuclease